MGSPETCPRCRVAEPWNRYSYRSHDGQGHPLIVYTDSAGDGDRDECDDPFHATPPAPAASAVTRAERDVIEEAVRWGAANNGWIVGDSMADEPSKRLKAAVDKYAALRGKE